MKQTETPITEYAEDQKPCLVAKKPCGCYVAACVLDDGALEEVRDWNIESDLDLPAVVDFLKEGNEWGATYEVRPVSFVRSGGLNFGCKHGKVGRALSGK